MDGIKKRGANVKGVASHVKMAIIPRPKPKTLGYSPMSIEEAKKKKKALGSGRPYIADKTHRKGMKSYRKETRRYLKDIIRSG